MSISRAGLRRSLGSRSLQVPSPPISRERSTPSKAGRIGHLRGKLSKVDPDSGRERRRGHLQDRPAARFDQLSGNVDHLQAKPPRVVGEGISRFGALGLLRPQAHPP